MVTRADGVVKANPDDRDPDTDIVLLALEEELVGNEKVIEFPRSLDTKAEAGENNGVIVGEPKSEPSAVVKISLISFG